MSERLKVLFAGLGSIGQRHLRNLRTLMGENVDILAFRARRQTPALSADMSVREGIDLEAEYSVRSFYNLETALEERPDVVFVTNPNSLHLPVALAAADAGCQLFIEKPIAHTMEGVEQLVDIVQRRNLVTLVGYQFRFHPGLQLIKSFLEEGRLGRVIGAHIVNGEYLPIWHPYEDYRQSHPAKRELGGGCLNIQTHELDYALWFFGLPRTVFAVGGHLSTLEVEVEDSVSLLLKCFSDGRPVPVHIHLDYLQRPPQRVCEVYGDAGRIRYDYYANLLEFSDTKTGKLEVYRFDKFERNQMFIDELKHFLACVRGEERPLVDLLEARRSMLIGETAKESIATGRAVGIAYE